MSEKNKTIFYFHPFFRILSVMLGLFLIFMSIYQQFFIKPEQNKSNFVFVLFFFAIGIFIGFRGLLMRFVCDQTGFDIIVLKSKERRINYLQIVSIKRAIVIVPMYVLNLNIEGRYTVLYLGFLSRKDLFFKTLIHGNPGITID